MQYPCHGIYARVTVTCSTGATVSMPVSRYLCLLFSELLGSHGLSGTSLSFLLTSINLFSDL